MGRLSCLALAIMGLTVLSPVRTHGPAFSSTRSQTASAASTDNDIDPNAIAALNKMAEYLRTLKAFEVRSVTRREDVLDDGQKIEYDGAVDLLARTPDRLRVEVNNDLQHRLFLYDGKNFTLFAERVNYYATVAAPPTIRELADDLQNKFEIEMPLRDLFDWGTSRWNAGDIKAGFDVGPSPVDGTTCEQFAFRQEGIDWQIWIQSGDYPLPRKYVITTRTDEARPQYAVVLTWNLAPSFNDAAFTFDPPKDAQKIVFAQADAPSSSEKR
jgi:hypothetical protein